MFVAFPVFLELRIPPVFFFPALKRGDPVWNHVSLLRFCRFFLSRPFPREGEESKMEDEGVFVQNSGFWKGRQTQIYINNNFWMS